MGVADNRTYKNEYLFNDKQNSVFGTTGTTEGDNPSINTDPKINTTIKENPYKSNVEIEGREIVLQPDLSALFKAVGKRHSRGGMDVLLKPNSFVFSDFEDLALSPKEHETFELKKGGKSSTDTPADVLKRNVDIKHYNSLVAILEDPHKDDLAKKSAVRMMEKYIKTLGNIAYIQEEKKGFPDGLPSFSEGTAPVYDPDLKEEIMANKQYAKAGGTIRNPYLQRGGKAYMQDAGTFNPLDNESRKLYGLPPLTPQQIQAAMDQQVKAASLNVNDPNSMNIYLGKTPSQNSYVAPVTTPTASTTIPKVSLNPGTTPTTPNPRQDRYTGQRPPYPDTWTNYYDKTQKQQYNAPDWIKPKDFYATPGLIDYMKTLDKQSGVDWDMNKADDAVWGWRHQAALAKFFPNGKPVTPADKPSLNMPGKLAVQITAPNQEQWPGNPVPNPKPNGVTDTGKKPFSTDIAFTPWQKRSHLFDWFNWLNVNKYGADRAHYNATFINPALVNPEQAVGDAKAMAWQQTQAANVLNPILRNAQGADAYGKVLNAIPGIRDKYDTTNVNTVNQFRQYNNQVKNNESLTNMQNDINYAKDSTTASVNYDNMKTYLANQAMSHTMKDVGDNQSLAWKQLQLNNPRYSFNFRTGQYDINPKDVRDAPEVAGADNLENMLKSIDFQKLDDKTKLQYLNIILKNKAVGFLGQDNSMKKGGKKNPYK